MEKTIAIGIVLVIAVALIMVLIPTHASIDIVNKESESIKLKLIEEGKYACCIKDPCDYCLREGEEHENGKVCDCIDDIMEGEAPCGECIGEILEGEGNPYLSKEQLINALVDEFGEENRDAVTRIIESKY